MDSKFKIQVLPFDPSRPEAQITQRKNSLDKAEMRACNRTHDLHWWKAQRLSILQACHAGCHAKSQTRVHLVDELQTRVHLVGELFGRRVAVGSRIESNTPVSVAWWREVNCSNGFNLTQRCRRQWKRHQH